jgi:hypothetical protein
MYNPQEFLGSALPAPAGSRACALLIRLTALDGDQQPDFGFRDIGHV